MAWRLCWEIYRLGCAGGLGVRKGSAQRQRRHQGKGGLAGPCCSGAIAEVLRTKAWIVWRVFKLIGSSAQVEYNEST
jgi:hypothetical protein